MGKIAIPKETTGYGYVSAWMRGHIGWWLPHHCCGYSRRTPEPPADKFNEYAAKTDRAFLCKITIEPILDSLGRPITKKPNKKTKEN